MRETDTPELAKKKPRGKIGFQTRGLYVGIALGLAYLDYSTKQDIQKWLQQQGDPVVINDFLNIVAHTNSGAAFGIFSSLTLGGFNLLAIVSAFLIVGLYAFLYVYPKLTHSLGLAIALMLGGGLGNGVERLLNGRVFDFIDLHIGNLHWPAFNVADICISLGAILAVLLIWKQPARK